MRVTTTLIVTCLIVISCSKDESIFVSEISFNPDCNYSSVTDIDGNTYRTIKIGDQTWMAENLRTKKLNDGKTLSSLKSNKEWETAKIAGYCWYDNNQAYEKVYGKLYNFYSVNTNKICPTGWHVPSDNEWKTLIDYLRETNSDANMLKEYGSSHWGINNYDATNEFGFTALPGGSRQIPGNFTFLGINGHWWTSTPSDIPNNDMGPIYYFMFNDNGYIGRNGYDYNGGFSIRCIKD